MGAFGFGMDFTTISCVPISPPELDLILFDLVVNVGDMAVYLLLVEVVSSGRSVPDLKGVSGNGGPFYEFPFL